MTAELEHAPGLPPSPEELLAEALSLRDPAARLERARRGLACFGDAAPPPTRTATGLAVSAEAGDEGWDDAEPLRALLLRQAYMAHVELRQLREAADVAEEMVRWSDRPDVAHHDAARVQAGLDAFERAIWHQRLAARHAPAHRRSFHLWCLATLQQQAGDGPGALATLERALRVAGPDRPLLKAHRALVRLEQGEPELELAKVLSDLHASPSREGYGRFLLGAIAHRMGDRAGASVHLRAFLNRNAGADFAKQLTLRHELRHARQVLAEIESD